ncbi:MAG: EAL domain-containing protein [Burkholderiaceae bacterium]
MKRRPPTHVSGPNRIRAAAEIEAARDPASESNDSGTAELAHELRVHQIELEMQNEELREAQQALEAAKDRYVDLYDFAPIGYLTLDARGAILEVNLTGTAMLGTDRARLVGRRFATYVTSPDRDRWQRHAATLLKCDEAGRIEVALQGQEARRIDTQLDGRRAQLQDGRLTLRITLTDITELKRIESELRLAATAFEAEESMMITDANGIIERVNKAFSHATGYSAADVVGQSARLLQSGRHDPSFYAAMWGSVRRAGFWQGEIWNRRKSGEIYPGWLTITAVRDDGTPMVRYVGTMRDISDMKVREDSIEQLAFYDPLTGLPNRRLMKDRLQHAIAVSTRTRREGALMFIDLDRFKTINDTLGHDKGDQLLQQVARRLTACVREGDTVARLGGDEFVVVLAADLSPAALEAAAQARAVGEKILAALNLPYELADRELICSGSIGIALFCDQQLSVDDLLKRADQAMYQAKSAGRNTLALFDIAAQEAQGLRSSLETSLRQAVRQGDFELHFQPVVTSDRQLVGAEALVRWRHAQRGLVEPDNFIPIAEDTGLIHALGRWVLDTACDRLAQWANDPPMAGLTLSVNISPKQLRDPGFVRQVIDTLDRSGAEPTRLKLELTESTMLDNVDDSIAKIQTLNAHGVGFSLDDFGTGYASLSYLKRLPLEQLKIDRSFVNDVMLHSHDAAIARSVIDLGRNLGLTVVAEGVENQAQCDLLFSYGCRVFQGNWFGAAAPEVDLRAMALRAAGTSAVPPRPWGEGTTEEV